MLPSRCLLFDSATALQTALEPYAGHVRAAGVLPVWSDGVQQLALLGVEPRRLSPRARQRLGTEAKLWPCWNDFGGKIEPLVDRGDPLLTAMREFAEETCGGFPADLLDPPQLAVWCAPGRYVLFPRRARRLVDAAQLRAARRAVEHSGDADQLAAANKTDFAWLPLDGLLAAAKNAEPILDVAGQQFVLHQFFSVLLAAPDLHAAIRQMLGRIVDNASRP